MKEPLVTSNSIYLSLMLSNLSQLVFFVTQLQSNFDLTFGFGHVGFTKFVNEMRSLGSFKVRGAFLMACTALVV